MSTYRVQPGTVQETLLIPLYGRAVENRKPEPALRDPRAEEIVAAIDYDFARLDGLQSLFGSVLRTSLFDHWVREFLAGHPTGTVVEIGAGLNTRYERVDDGRATWFELDLPDVAELRRVFLDDTPNRRMLAASVTEESWTREVAGAGGPYFFSAEAVLPFLDEAAVRGVVDMLAERFPGSLLALDTSSPWIVENQDTHDALSKVAARMRWGCAEAEELREWRSETEVLASHTLVTLPSSLTAALSSSYREMLAGLAGQRLPQVEGYRMSLMRLA